MNDIEKINQNSYLLSGKKNELDLKEEIVKSNIRIHEEPQYKLLKKIFSKRINQFMRRNFALYFLNKFFIK